jgi:hypothetical protein
MTGSVDVSVGVAEVVVIVVVFILVLAATPAACVLSKGESARNVATTRIAMMGMIQRIYSVRMVIFLSFRGDPGRVLSSSVHLVSKQVVLVGGAKVLPTGMAWVTERCFSGH